MVRGLDYYTKTTFEITAPYAGAQNAVVGGGRYDGLVKELGGPDIPGIGFAIGCERLIASMHRKEEAANPGRLRLFVAALGREAELFAYTLVNSLRISGIRADMDFTGKGLKGQMTRADKLKSDYVLIIGDRELSEKKAALRNMRTGLQTIVEIENLETSLLNIMK
jgi:histidyl-tRNA synthetase